MLTRWNLQTLFLVLAAGVGLYLPSLHHPVFFDDIVFFNRNVLNDIFIAGFDFNTRWLPYFITAWIDLIFDDKIFAQRIFSLVLHLLTGFMVYSLIKQVSQHTAPHRNNERAALAAALLFLLHPLAVYATGYLIQRTILMATLFGLLSLNTYFDGLITRRKSYFFFSALFYFLSAFSKEHAVMMPMAALALTPLALPMTRQNCSRLVLPFALYAPIAALVILEKLGILGRSYEPLAEPLIILRDLNETPLMLWLLSVVTQAALYFKYLGLTLFPNPEWMSVDMRVPFADDLAQPKYIFGLLAFITTGLTGLVWLLRRGRCGLVGYALLAPLLLFVVEMSVVRIQEPFVLYRAYLWIPLMFMVIPALTYALPDWVFWCGTLIVAVALATASTDRLNSFSSHYSLWDDAVRKLPLQLVPGSARAYNNRCQQNLLRGDLQSAIVDCSRALQVDPKYKLAYQNRAFAYMKQGDFQAALQDAQTIVRLYPDYPHAHTLLGAMYQGAGMLENARASYEISCASRSLAACVELEAMKAKSTLHGNGLNAKLP